MANRFPATDTMRVTDIPATVIVGPYDVVKEITAGRIKATWDGTTVDPPIGACNRVTTVISLGTTGYSFSVYGDVNSYAVSEGTVSDGKITYPSHNLSVIRPTTGVAGSYTSHIVVQLIVEDGEALVLGYENVKKGIEPDTNIIKIGIPCSWDEYIPRAGLEDLDKNYQHQVIIDFDEWSFPTAKDGSRVLAGFVPTRNNDTIYGFQQEVDRQSIKGNFPLNTAFITVGHKNKDTSLYGYLYDDKKGVVSGKLRAYYGIKRVHGIYQETHGFLEHTYSLRLLLGLSSNFQVYNVNLAESVRPNFQVGTYPAWFGTQNLGQTVQLVFTPDEPAPQMP